MVIKKHILFILILLCFLPSVSFCQQLFYQNTFKGGVCGDGRSYNSHDYLFPDTVHFANVVPSTATVKKAFLILHKSNSVGFIFPTEDFIYTSLYNDSLIQIDSSNEVTPTFFHCYNNPLYAFQKITIKDVTKYTLKNGNTLIRPQQYPINVDYCYTGVYLLILYEDSSMPNCNIAVFINNQTYTTPMSHQLPGINPISNANDVGLSIWSEFAYSTYPLNFSLTSSLGTFTLGTLLERTIPSTGLLSEKLAGSFDYKNNTLTGLADDTPDAFIDSTDAVANISSYVANNTANFNLTSTTISNIDCSGIIDAFFLAYNTPCPSHGFKDTLTTHTICQGQNVTLGVQSPGNTYSWYPANTLSSATIISPVATPTTTTNYVVSVDSMGCKHTEQVTVFVTPAPKADTIYVGDNVCGGPAGSLIVLPGHGPYEPYTYSLNNGTFVSDTNFTNLSSGTYSITIKNNVGCTWQSNSLTIKDTLKAIVYAASSPLSGVAPFSTILTSQNSFGVNTYDWYINNQLTNNNSFFNYTFTEAGLYSVTLIAYNTIASCADTASLTIQVLPKDTSGIFIPNVFSPNGDGVNDVFEVSTSLDLTITNFEIYNRFGTAVFTSEISNQKSKMHWDGRTTSGMECSEGTYFYVISYKALNSQKLEEKSAKGFVSLMR